MTARDRDEVRELAEIVQAAAKALAENELQGSHHRSTYNLLALRLGDFLRDRYSRRAEAEPGDGVPVFRYSGSEIYESLGEGGWARVAVAIDATSSERLVSLLNRQAEQPAPVGDSFDAEWLRTKYETLLKEHSELRSKMDELATKPAPPSPGDSELENTVKHVANELERLSTPRSFGNSYLADLAKVLRGAINAGERHAQPRPRAES